MGAYELAFELHRTRRALDAANSILKNEGLIGILPDTANIADQYEEDSIAVILSEHNLD